MTRVTGPLASPRSRLREAPAADIPAHLVRAAAHLPWGLVSLAAVALVVRLALVPYGLPYELDPDERDFVESAWRMIEQGRWDPRWYGHPAGTLMGVMALLYAGYAAVGVALGAFDGIAAAGQAYRADVTDFFVIARVVTALSGTAVVLVTFALLRRLEASRFWAGVGALLVALAMPMVVYSSLVRADMLLTALLLTTVLVMLRALERPTGRRFVLAGVLLGFAVTTKYPGALALVPIVGVNVALVVRERISPRTGLIWLAGTLGVGVLVAFAVAPYLFINIMETLAWVKLEARTEHIGGTGAGLPSNLWAYLTEALPWALGSLGAALGVIGLAIMARAGRPWLVPLTFGVYLLFISALSLWWLRWALPLVPFAVVGAVVLVERVDARIRSTHAGRASTVVRAALAGMLVVPLVAPTFDVVRARWSGDDARLRAIDWIHANVPDGATILIDSYTTQVATDRYEVLVTWAGELIHWSDVSGKRRPDGWFSTIGAQWRATPAALLDALDRHGVDYVVLNRLWIDLYREEPPPERAGVAAYDALLDALPVARSFDEGTITILCAAPVCPANDAMARAGSSPMAVGTAP